MINKNVQLIEGNINKILFNICLFVTIIALAMVLVEFFSRGLFPPTNISVFYIGVLLIYALHKEALHWIQQKGTTYQQRRGEYFVYTWIIVTAFLYLINFISRDYFSYSANGQQLFTLTEMTFTTLEVGAVFILTRAVKITKIQLFERKA